MTKIIHFLANDGSPLGVTYKSIWGQDGRLGVGGAELAMLTLCGGFEKRGYDVTLYNNPNEGGASPFKQKTLDVRPRRRARLLNCLPFSQRAHQESKGKTYLVFL
jgi:hypothetical protein